MSGALYPEACRHVRLHVGADPHSLPADVEAHLATCESCRRFRDETLMLDARVRAALELQLAQFRSPVKAARPARRFALAASLMLGMFMAGGIWLLRTPPALAGEVVEHVLEEPDSWDARTPMQAADIRQVLDMAGVDFSGNVPVVYAAPCLFRGRRIAHLVILGPEGPKTVMLLPHVSVDARREFSEHGFRGVLLPAGTGSVAVLARGAEVPAALEQALVSAVRWR